MGMWLFLLGLGALTTFAIYIFTNSQSGHRQSKSTPGSPRSPKSDLPDHITSWDHETGLDQAQWCERLLHYISDERHGGRYNVFGIKTTLEYSAKFDGIVEEFYPVVYKQANNGRSIKYRFVVFEKGEVFKMGDGGAVNWIWSGNFTQPAVDMVTFEPIGQSVSS